MHVPCFFVFVVCLSRSYPSPAFLHCFYVPLTNAKLYFPRVNCYSWLVTMGYRLLRSPVPLVCCHSDTAAVLIATLGPADPVGTNR
uniref:Putative secreted protein n=1 Tax=Anopheles marajoara TaxID=58244 RepID=A0A2M4CAJ8_9DIPT